MCYCLAKNITGITEEFYSGMIIVTSCVLLLYIFYQAGKQ